MEVELPSMQKDLYDVYHSQGLEIMAINPIDPASTIKNIKSTKGLSYFLLVDTGGAVFNQYKFNTVFPQNFIVDSEGIIRYLSQGYKLEELTQVIEEYLAKRVDASSWGGLKLQYK